MTIKEVKRKITRSVEDCLHNNNESIIFNTNIKKLYTTEYFDHFTTKYEVMILDLTDKQKEVLKNKLEYYARVQQKNSNTWYFFFVQDK